MTRYTPFLMALAVALVIAGLAYWLAAVFGPAGVAWQFGLTAFVGTFTVLAFGRVLIGERADLRVHQSMEDARRREVLQLRLYNRGKRPITLDRIGFWHERSDEATAFHGWTTWGLKAPYPLPSTVTEADPKTVIAYAMNVAHWLVKKPRARWLFIDPLGEKRRWYPLHPEFVKALEDAHPKAYEGWQEQEAKKAEEDARKAEAAAQAATRAATSHPSDPSPDGM